MTLDQAINAHRSDLSAIDLEILRLVKQDTKRVESMSITELAGLCNVSTATIVRMARKLGYAGFAEFKYVLKSSVQDVPSTTGSDPLDALGTDVELTMRAFRNNRSLTEVYDALDRAPIVYAFGAGHGQRLMLNEFARCLTNHRKSMAVLSGFSELSDLASELGPDDMVFVVSQDCDPTHLRDSLQTMSFNRVQTVSVTPLIDNELAALAQHNLYYVNSNLDPRTRLNRSTFLTLHLVLHMLYDGYAQHTKTTQSPVA